MYAETALTADMLLIITASMPNLHTLGYRDDRLKCNAAQVQALLDSMQQLHTLKLTVAQDAASAVIELLPSYDRLQLMGFGWHFSRQLIAHWTQRYAEL